MPDMSEVERLQLGAGSHHRGYVLWERNVWGMATGRMRRPWGAYTANSSNLPWFEGDTPVDVVQMIDAAFDELPDPVY